jgi:hypothetical protein
MRDSVLTTASSLHPRVCQYPSKSRSTASMEVTHLTFFIP